MNDVPVYVRHNTVPIPTFQFPDIDTPSLRSNHQ